MEGSDIHMISDERLVEGCLRDNREYQEILYRRYADRMYNVALSYSDSEDDACDILQEGFIRVFRQLHKFRFECALEGWIRRIIVNKAIELYRKNRRLDEIMEDYGTGIQPIVEGVLDKINSSDLVQIVNGLPSKAAMVLKLYAIEGYAHKEIAEMLNISVGTSKSQLNRARALLKEKISIYYG